MRSLHIAQLDRDVSRLGIGSMIFSPEQKALTFELLDAFLRLGGSVVDTAEHYGGGDSERAIGLWLADRGRREEVVILTKGCHYPQKEISEAAIHQTITGNLERLGTDYIDLWLLHRDNPAVRVEEIVGALNDEVSRGRVRAFGASNWSVDRIRAANEYAERKGLVGMAASSPHVCLAKTKGPFWPGCTTATEADLAWYAETGTAVFAWSSQGRGFFLEKSGPDDTDPDLIRAYHDEENFERLRRARQLGRDKGVSAVQIALAYVLNLHAPIVALVGPATVGEIESCVAATEIRLSGAQLEWLDLKRPSL